MKESGRKAPKKGAKQYKSPHAAGSQHNEGEGSLAPRENVADKILYGEESEGESAQKALAEALEDVNFYKKKTQSLKKELAASKAGKSNKDDGDNSRAIINVITETISAPLNASGSHTYPSRLLRKICSSPPATTA
jgi:ATP-dependent exoDNAse (exonuclease V) beta subunit